MKCPSCDADTSVMETRKSPVGTRRRRSCACGVRLSTMEVIVPDQLAFRGEVRLVPTFELARIRKMIDRLTVQNSPRIVQPYLDGEKVEELPEGDHDHSAQ